MEYRGDRGHEVCDQIFAQRVKELSKAHVDRCYQCYVCTAGCPVVYAMDYYPHQLMRMVQLGVKKRVLSCSTIWICATCETCATRCPNDIDLVRVMDALREIVLEEGLKVKEKKIVSMHKAFLSLIKSLGRQHEISLLVLLRMNNREIFKDMLLGMKIFLKGKLKIMPHKIEGIEQIRGIFERSQVR